MTRGVKVRLVTFVVLAAVGIVYIAATYLGIVDKVLGRGLTVHATLPKSGGLFVGSEVDYRGVKVGKVTSMQVTRDGVRLTMLLKDGTELPTDSSFHVANLTAVGEQYLDFEPTSTAGPYAANGHTFVGSAASLPVSTDEILINLSTFVNSLHPKDLRTVVHELGTMFTGNAENLGTLIDSAGKFVRQAKAHEDDTIGLLDSGGAVLKTQQQHKGDIKAFAKGLADISATLKQSDPQLRTILQGGTSAVREVNSLLSGLEPTLPLFISNLVTVNQVATARLPALEQMLVAFPLLGATGFTGTPGDGFGHLNMQFAYTLPVCTEGYLPAKDWPSPLDTRDLPLYHAKCSDPRAQLGYTGNQPLNQRGVNFMPKVGASTSTAYRVAPYDARTRKVALSGGRTVTLGSSARSNSALGSDEWEQLLIGPVKGMTSRQGAGGR